MKEEKMMTDVNSAEYWQAHYERGDINWDMGHISPPLKTYIDEHLVGTDKSVQILIAGAGNAYEAQYLHEQGFSNVFVVDFAKAPLENLSKKFPDFPKEHLIQADFFTLDSAVYQFDYSIEQTFLCAIDPSRRTEYVSKMHQLLKPQGKLVGLLWDGYFSKEANENNPESKPPFGGNPDEYRRLFSEKFTITMTNCTNSHPARQGRELFIEFVTR